MEQRRVLRARARVCACMRVCTACLRAIARKDEGSRGPRNSWRGRIWAGRRRLEIPLYPPAWEIFQRDSLIRRVVARKRFDILCVYVCVYVRAERIENNLRDVHFSRARSTRTFPGWFNAPGGRFRGVGQIS